MKTRDIPLAEEMASRLKIDDASGKKSTSSSVFPNLSSKLQLNVAKSALLPNSTTTSDASQHGTDGNHAIIQTAWSAFDNMTESQRNTMLKGLLNRCSSKQVDMICTSLNLKTYETVKPTHTSNIHTNDVHAKLVRSRKNYVKPTLSPLQQRKADANKRSDNAADGTDPSGDSTEEQNQVDVFAPQKPSTITDNVGDSKHFDANLYMRLFNSTCDIETLKRQASTLNNNAMKHFVTFLTLRVRKLQSIIEVMRKLTATGNNSERLIQVIINSLIDVVGAQNATIYIFNDRTNEIVSKSSTWLQTNSKCAIQKIFGGTQLLRGEAINMFNVKATENYDQKMEEHYKKVDLDCICSAPIFADGSNRVVGFIEILNKTEGHPYFSAEDEFVVRCFSSLVTLLSRTLHLGGSMAQSLDLADSSGKKVDDIKSFISRASALGQEMEFEGLLTVIMDTLRDIVDAEFCNIFMADNEKREYTLVTPYIASQGIDKAKNQSKIPFAKGLVGLAGKNGQVINVNDPTMDSRYERNIDGEVNAALRNLLYIPLKGVKDELLGVIQLGNKIPSTAAFDTEDELVATSFSSLASIIIEKSIATRKLTSALKEMTTKKHYYEDILHSMSLTVITLDSLGRAKLVINPELFSLNTKVLDEMNSTHFETWLGGEVNSILVEDVKITFASGEKTVGENYILTIGENNFIINYEILKLPTTGNKEDGGNNMEILLLIENLEQEKRFRNSLARNLAPDIVNHLVTHNPEILEGINQKATVMVVDIKNFKEMSKVLPVPERLAMLNDFYAIVQEAVTREDGVLDKYVGDSVTAFFGPPYPQATDAVRAVSCATSVQKLLADFNKQLEAEGRPMMDVGIGISTGVVLVGVYGDRRMDFTILGDAVKTATTLESITTAYNVSIICDENTREEVKDKFQLRELDSITIRNKDCEGFGFDGIADFGFVSSIRREQQKEYMLESKMSASPAKGNGNDAVLKSQQLMFTSETFSSTDSIASPPAKIYELIDSAGKEMSQDSTTGLICFELGLAEYRMCNWREALAHFKKAVQLGGDQPSRVFIWRCKMAMDNLISLPEDWSGAWQFMAN